MKSEVSVMTKKEKMDVIFKDLSKGNLGNVCSHCENEKTFYNCPVFDNKDDFIIRRLGIIDFICEKFQPVEGFDIQYDWWMDEFGCLPSQVKNEDFIKLLEG